LPFPALFSLLDAFRKFKSLCRHHFYSTVFTGRQVRLSDLHFFPRFVKSSKREKREKREAFFYSYLIFLFLVHARSKEITKIEEVSQKPSLFSLSSQNQKIQLVESLFVFSFFSHFSLRMCLKTTHPTVTVKSGEGEAVGIKAQEKQGRPP
jgi:hypothetical protein